MLACAWRAYRQGLGRAKALVDVGGDQVNREAGAALADGIGLRAVGCLRGDHDLARLRHRIGNHAAHWVAGAGGAAGADAEELLARAPPVAKARTLAAAAPAMNRLNLLKLLSEVQGAAGAGPTARQPGRTAQ